MSLIRREAQDSGCRPRGLGPEIHPYQDLAAGLVQPGMLSQSKSLENVRGAERLDNIQYAGRAGRLFNLLRPNIDGSTTSTLSGAQVETICQLNGMDRSVRSAGLLMPSR